MQIGTALVITNFGNICYKYGQSYYKSGQQLQIGTIITNRCTTRILSPGPSLAAVLNLRNSSEYLFFKVSGRLSSTGVKRNQRLSSNFAFNKRIKAN